MNVRCLIGLGNIYLNHFVFMGEGIMNLEKAIMKYEEAINVEVCILAKE